MYTAIKTPYGTYEVSKDGQRVSTTSESGLTSFGLSSTNLGLSAEDKAAVKKAGLAGGLSLEESTNISLGKLPTTNASQPPAGSSALPAQTNALQSTGTLPSLPQTGQTGQTGQIGQTGLPTPPTSQDNSSNDPFLKAYLASLTPTAEETNLQGQSTALDTQMRNLNQGQGVMNANLEDQPIAMPFITGQESAVEKRYALQRGDVENRQQTLQQKLVNEQAKRQSSIDVSKTALDYSLGQQQRTDKLTQQEYQNALSQAQYQNQITQQEYQNALSQTQYQNKLAQQQFTNKLQQQKANQKADTPATPSVKTTTTVSGLNSGKTFVSGRLQYTSQAYQEDQATMLDPNIKDAQGNPNFGSDGYVNPSVYLELYNAWISEEQGGLRSDFFQIYPIKDYINPANTWSDIIELGGGTKNLISA